MVTAVPYKRTSSALSFSTEPGDHARPVASPTSEDGTPSTTPHDAPASSSSSSGMSAPPYPFERTFSSSASSTSSQTANDDSTHNGFGYASAPALAPPLTDLIETFFESRLDLFDRKLKDWREGVASQARARVRRTREKALSRAEVKAMEKEVVRMRRKAAERVDKLGRQWRDAKTVRLRDKISFVTGVLNLVFSSLLITTRPDLVPLAYSIQCIYFLPLRVISYSRRKWHYFLFDYCYWISALCNIYLWVCPQSKFLFQALYCASHGPLAWSVATWRNSMVFHDLEKITSLYIHIYPPLVFTTIAHFIPREQAEVMYPALKGLDRLDPWACFGFTCGVYCVWQFLYWAFISTSKKEKIESGARINSYSTLARGKGAVAKMLGKYPAGLREPLFMALQAAYTIVTTLPAPLLFYPSKTASSVFLIVVLTISVWNGATWYIEVWARKFEKELLALRAEMEMAKQQEQDLADATGAGGASADVSRRSSMEVHLSPATMEVESGGGGGAGSGSRPGSSSGGAAKEAVGAVMQQAQERVVENGGEGESRKRR